MQELLMGKEANEYVIFKLIKNIKTIYLEIMHKINV